jgi:N6-L-threonylcarbamoyladenine synthase
MQNNFKLILGIETSCDETAAAILQKEDSRITILSNIIASSASIQSKYGGIIPEQAAREQLSSIIPVVEESLNQAKLKPKDLDAIAVTYGPGLIGSLLIGVESAKTLSLIWDKPLIPVNHLTGHFYANWIEVGHARKEEKSFKTPSFPCIGLLVSGGHTDLVLFKSHSEYKYLGGTRDDAAGECFDKCARLLGLPYPGGPEIARMAKKGNPKPFKLPRPMWDSKDFDFSYSGLKTAVSNLVSSIQINEETQADLCASIEQAIIDPLIKKTILAAKTYRVEQIIVAGGVAANEKLIFTLKENFAGKIFSPPPYLCTDNASMIASRAFFENPLKNPLSTQANPNLSL